MPENAKYIDTHCHIDLILEREQITWEELRARMSAHPPESIIHVACHPDKLQWAYDFASNEPSVYGAFGIHPHEASLYDDNIKSWLREHLVHPKALALGEIGLDYHYDYSPREIQKKVFIRQMELACSLNKPIVLHTREADEDTLAILRSFDCSDLRVHVHCYTGSIEFAQSLLSLQGQYYFGFTGVLTFKNGENVRNAARTIPTNRLLLETDGPYLAPIPWRGKTAHPGMIPAIAQALASARECTINEIWNVCRDNTRLFYGI